MAANVVVKEGGLDEDISAEEGGREHLGLGRCLDEALPGVRALGDDEAELEEPLCNEPSPILPCLACHAKGVPESRESREFVIMLVNHNFR